MMTEPKPRRRWPVMMDPAMLEQLAAQAAFWRERYEIQHRKVHTMEDEIAALQEDIRLVVIERDALSDVLGSCAGYINAQDDEQARRIERQILEVWHAR